MPKNPDSVAKALRLLGEKNNDAVATQLKEGIDNAVAKITADSAEVETVAELTDKEKLKFEQILSDIFGKSLSVFYRVNHSLLGGFKVSVGDWKFDATLISQLSSMRKTLGGSYG